MKIRRKRSFHEITTPKTDLPKSRSWFNGTTGKPAIAPQTSQPAPVQTATAEPQQASQDTTQEQTSSSPSPLLQRSLLGPASVLQTMTTLPPQGSVQRSAAEENSSKGLYPRTIPRSDRALSPTPKSPILQTVQRSPEDNSRDLNSQSKSQLAIAWHAGQPALQHQPDNSPLATQWQPSQLVQRKTQDTSVPTIQRDDKTSGTTNPQTQSNQQRGYGDAVAIDNSERRDSDDWKNERAARTERQKNTREATGAEHNVLVEEEIGKLNELEDKVQTVQALRSEFLQKKAEEETKILTLIYPIDAWLSKKARQDGYLDLYYTYANLNPLQRLMALKTLGAKTISLDEVKAQLKSKRAYGIIGKKVINWAGFAGAINTVQATDPWNDTIIRDTAELGGLVASVGAASVSQAAGLVNNSTAVVDWSSEIASLLGVVGLTITAYREITELCGDSDLGLFKTRLGKLGATLSDIGRYASTALNTLATASDHGTALLDKLSLISGTAATASAGAFAIAGGAFNIAVGVSQYRNAGKNQRKLNELSDTATVADKDDQTEEERQDKEDELRKAARVGAQTQGWDKNVGAAKVVKGTAMVTGGALLLLTGLGLAALGPAGWIVLAAAGLIGGIAAIAKYFAWKRRKTDFVDRELGISDEKQDQNQDENLGFFGKVGKKLNVREKRRKAKDKEALRNRKLQALGFSDVEQYYYHRLNQMAANLLSVAKDELKRLHKNREHHRQLVLSNDKEKKQAFDKYLGVSDTEYSALHILRRLGLEVTVGRVLNNDLPKHNNVVRQLDYSQ
ncbi:hypothetical protein [Roseofilum casamattae]|uniref:Uncharacterized protein n=1 Tax=Roseofilum casamattae BLCC-M143 TaxID=3022442 RepID=A0ABT7C0Q7_9CYAN|nr:hypothetical protein [Roseofilum casamattae]MDJ1184895.1 hypothetical protein [Roseofilum casamattae BLCC-M143]